MGINYTATLMVGFRFDRETLERVAADGAVYSLWEEGEEYDDYEIPERIAEHLNCCYVRETDFDGYLDVAFGVRVPEGPGHDLGRFDLPGDVLWEDLTDESIWLALVELGEGLAKLGFDPGRPKVMVIGSIC